MKSTIALGALLCLAGALPAFADDPCARKSDEPPIVTLERLNAPAGGEHCLGGTLDTSAVAVAVWNPKLSTPPADGDKEKFRRAQLADIFTAAGRQLTTAPLQTDRGKAAAALLAQEADQAKSVIGASPYPPPREALKTNTWAVKRLPDGAGSVSMTVSLSVLGGGWRDILLAGDQGILDSGCFRQTTTDCVQSLQDAQLVATVANRISYALTRFGESIVPAEADYMSFYSTQWHAYFNDARSQTPLELLLNDYLFVKSAEFRKVKTSATADLAPAPTHQFILLHPRAGLEYVGEADPGSRFKPAAFMEVAGYNRWAYAQDGSMGNAYGASLIASYSDRAGVKAVGYGVAFYFRNKYVLGLTYRKGTTIGIMVSADLQGILLKYGSGTQTAVQNGTYGQ